MKGNKFAFVILLGMSVVVLLLYSCSLPMPMLHGKKRIDAMVDEVVEGEEDIDDEEYI